MRRICLRGKRISRFRDEVGKAAPFLREPLAFSPFLSVRLHFEDLEGGQLETTEVAIKCHHLIA